MVSHFKYLLEKFCFSEFFFFFFFKKVVSFDFWLPRFPECVTKVCHAEELPILFGTPPLAGFNFTTEEIALSNLMQDYWTNFARTGNPNQGLNTPSLSWPRFNPKEMENLRFATPSEIEKNWDITACNFFDKIGYHHGW